MTAFLVTVNQRRAEAAPDQLYLINGDLDDRDLEQLAATLLHDPVVQQLHWQRLDALAEVTREGWWAEIAYRPGVTDNEAESIRLGAQHLGLAGSLVVRTLRRWPIAQQGAEHGLYNPLIQTALVYSGSSLPERMQWYRALLQTPAETIAQVAQVALRDADDQELLRISRQGILALDLAEMQAIQAYYRAEGRDPSDGELETLAQTWSEHCSHKTFKARVRYQNRAPSVAVSELHPALAMLADDIEIDSLIRTFLMVATTQVIAAQQAHPADARLDVLSAFVDNAGIVAFNDEYEISFKVETHNHPSALEPFGGANTGVGGVVRDVLGVSAQPIANTDVLCFGPLDLPVAGAGATLPDGVLHPSQVAAGVVAGVRDYGNKLGIPTVNGAVLYDPGYTANPLVYCGTVGLAPRGRHPRGAKPGNLVVVLGGRTGRDGIHGATFSSVELTHTTAAEVGSAVQIGDPITEKKLIDVIIQARDAGLYRAITDCGAGGLSSAVGEMGEETGALVHLEAAPLKYAGLQPWEIWLSEAQERMVLAVPPERRDELLALCAAEDVEASVIGTFTDDGFLTVRHHDRTVVRIEMAFLHGGRPQRILDAIWAPQAATVVGIHAEVQLESQAALLQLLAHPNIASKEQIVRTYDHEVQGRTVIKPLVGVRSDGPGDAAVLQPLRTSQRGIALGCGINPRYGLTDPYWMALACVDEALRNIVAVGGDPGQAAILDNFCWGDPRKPDRMAGLTRAAAGCYDAALAYGAPFISGKDSLNNEYLAADGTRTPIPPTLLISALAIVPDVGHCTTMDLKEAGNLIYLVGLTRDALLGSHYVDLAQVGSIDGSELPMVDLALAPKLLAAVHASIAAGLVRACHDLSEGGLAVAAAEMAIAGGLGMSIDLARVPQPGAVDERALLFSESPTRLLIEVRPADAMAFEAKLADLPHAQIGTVVTVEQLHVTSPIGARLIDIAVADLKRAWQGTPVV
jgi:phosphoribosylformylglycinamidine synthase